jgi:hypothetical protein
MKKIIFIFTICFWGFLLIGFSQGTLQFNKVELLTFDGGNLSPYKSPVYTVPSGKVWKIESAGAASDVSVYRLNGFLVDAQGINTIGTNNKATNLPIWLPENTTIEFSETSGAGRRAYISIIEFNVVP